MKFFASSMNVYICDQPNEKEFAMHWPGLVFFKDNEN